MQEGKLNILLDAFWGSSGKGKTSSFLADKFGVTRVSSSNFPNAGHCCGEDTYITTNRGLERLGDVVRASKSNTSIVNMDGSFESVSHFVADGIRKVNTILLKNGISIDCTDVHRFLVWNSEKSDVEWVRSIDLDPETHSFLFPKSVAFNGGSLLPTEWTSADKPNKTKIGLPFSEEMFASYLGLLVGDGYYARKTNVSIAFHTSQIDVLNKIRAMYSEMGITNQSVVQVGDKECFVLDTSQCSGLMELFELVNLKLAIKSEKQTPKKILTSNVKIMGAYLSGLFDSDGSVKSDRVTLSNCSESVVRDAQAMLHVLGISGFITFYDDDRDDTRMRQWCLSISGSRNLSIFQDKVGMLSEIKQQKLRGLVQSINHVGQIININSSVRVELRKRGFKSDSGNKGVRESTIEKLAESGYSGPVVESLRKYHIIQIKSIEFESKEIEVFDLTVPGTHSYLANGCVAHNTATFKDGTKFIAKAIPTAAILKKVKGVGMQCWITPGSGFAWAQLIKEWDESGKPEINIHSRASIVTTEHKERESQGNESTKHIASTMQGSAAAMVDKVLRKADCQLAETTELHKVIESLRNNDKLMNEFFTNDITQEFLEKVHVVDAWDFRKLTHQALHNGHPWLHEGSQGYALSIDHGSHFPFCTSRNASIQSAMDHLAVPPKLVGDVYLNLRTMPIRVGNVVEDGVQKGYSGDFYPDCHEMTWEQVAREAGMPEEEAKKLSERERTTVTKRVRRVCTFSFSGLKDAVATNGATKLIVNFIQYINWQDAGLMGEQDAFLKLSKKSRSFIDQVEEVAGVPVVLIGTGALHEEMISRM